MTTKAIDDPRQSAMDRSDVIQAGGAVLLGVGGALWCVPGGHLVAAGFMLTALLLLARSSPTRAQRRMWNALERYVAQEEAKEHRSTEKSIVA